MLAELAVLVLFALSAAGTNVRGEKWSLCWIAKAC